MNIIQNYSDNTLFLNCKNLQVIYFFLITYIFFQRVVPKDPKVSTKCIYYFLN